MAQLHSPNSSSTLFPPFSSMTWLTSDWSSNTCYRSQSIQNLRVQTSAMLSMKTNIIQALYTWGHFMKYLYNSYNIIFYSKWRFLIAYYIFALPCILGRYVYILKLSLKIRQTWPDGIYLTSQRDPESELSTVQRVYRKQVVKQLTCVGKNECMNTGLIKWLSFTHIIVSEHILVIYLSVIVFMYRTCFY